MLKRLYRQIHMMIFKRKHEVSPKGKYVRKYCLNIINGKDYDYNQSYEEVIEELQNRLSVSRHEAAVLLYEFLSFLDN